MLTYKEYLKEFNKLQKLTIKATDNLIKLIAPGMTEKEIADKYYFLLEDYDFTKHWYPILVYSGEMTGKPITRRIHLPSSKIKVKKNDIVFVDSTPMKGTVWSNWCDTVVIGNNQFYKELIETVRNIVNKTESFAKTQATKVGELYDYATNLINESKLKVLDPYKDIGHSIFQVREHQTVNETPMEDRLLLSKSYKNAKLK